jgi:hypothetical protein
MTRLHVAIGSMAALIGVIAALREAWITTAASALVVITSAVAYREAQRGR